MRSICVGQVLRGVGVGKRGAGGHILDNYRKDDLVKWNHVCIGESEWAILRGVWVDQQKQQQQQQVCVFMRFSCAKMGHTRHTFVLVHCQTFAIAFNYLSLLRGHP